MTAKTEKPCCEPQPSTKNAPKNVPIKIDIHKCIGCGICVEVCPFDLPQPNSIGRYEISRPEHCTECSACKRNCPVDAIEMEEQKGCGCIWCSKEDLTECC